MKVELHNLPPDLSAPPPHACGWLAFQHSSGKAWRKIDGAWLPIDEANAIAEARKQKK
ncbi:hypothetical protein [Bradyrhizobium glycinis]|uniref:hypothetical protein n=1 Tax=Bradyrhizobium glycinis TaxID=2751812 RepID=UPI0018D70E8B|nr:hypothetical protein [Bradyrhizobium glycinis]MBH5369907.1 hypothetical protein [Bradyrhizobium glycinis]